MELVPEGYKWHFSGVLILLLMEYGHGESIYFTRPFRMKEGLNPSFNGIWSWSQLH